MNQLISSFLCFVFLIQIPIFLAAQNNRLENEFKLSVPKKEVDSLWKFIENTFVSDEIIIDGKSLSGQKSIEKFIDLYFDNKTNSLANFELGLRHRKRFKDDILFKELIQLKMPYSEDKMVRSEIKFEVDNNYSKNDLRASHPLLKHLNNADKEALSYYLAAYKIRPESLLPTIKLKQTRYRVYLRDSTDDNIATITLDKVKNYKFPYQEFTEMELELNEVRYTNTDHEDQKLMIKVNESIKNKLLQKFPNLIVDQKPKYNKMKALSEKNLLSKLAANYMWLILLAIILISGITFLKQQFA